MAYHTAQRELLIDFLRQRSDTAFTVEEIAAALNGDHAPGKSTLYRLITRLVEEGQVKRFVRGNSRQFVYQLVDCAHRDAHLHMKCTACGRLYHLDHTASDALLQDVLRQCDFAVDEKQTVLFGYCKHCHKGEKSV